MKDRFILILDPVIRRGDSVDLSIQVRVQHVRAQWPTSHTRRARAAAEGLRRARGSHCCHYHHHVTTGCRQTESVQGLEGAHARKLDTRQGLRHMFCWVWFARAQIVSASIEAGIIEETGKLIPGIGNFEQRYESGRAKPE